MKKLASVLLAGTMISGAALAFNAAAQAQTAAPFILAQAELVPPPPDGVPPEEGKQKQKGEGKQERKQERQEQRQERKQERQEQKPPREAPPAPVEKLAPPPVEKQAPPPPPVEKLAPPPVEKSAPPPVERQAPPPPPVEKLAPPPVEPPAPPPPPPVEKLAPPPVEKSAPPVPDAPPAGKQKRLEKQMEKSDGPTPPIPPIAPRTQAPPAPITPDAVPPPAPVPPAATDTPPVPGAPPPAPVPGAAPATQTAPETPSVAPAPPPAGEKPAIPPEELKGGQRTPEQRERATERADQEFKSRDKKNDARFGRKIEERGDRTIIRESDSRVIVRDGDRTVIRSDENERLGRNARDVRQERRGNQTVTIIQRPDGSEIVTIKDDDGNLIRRVRREGNREIVIIDNEGAWARGGRWDRDRGWRDRDRDSGLHLNFYLDLPPVRVAIPRDEYIIDSDTASYEEYEEALAAPPLVQSERSYSLQEVTQNIRLRERVRSIDLNSITFPTAEWTVPPDQIPKLEDLARAIKAAVERDPSQVYLVEGHTDAVGSQIDNLSLSDRRAEEVAAILTEHFQIPAENLVTQGYGEDYLKVNTIAANEDNRRVTIRNITELLGTQQSQAAPQ